MRLSPEDIQALLITRQAQSAAATRQQRLYQGVKAAIVAGELPGGLLLPGGRSLATLLGLSRNTVEGALERLAVEGFLVRGPQGNRVIALEAATATPATASRPPRLATRLRDVPTHGADRESLALAPGIPALRAFPLRRWRRLVDSHYRQAGSALLGYGPPCGEPALRNALAAHLTLTRGIPCRAEQIVITEGSQEALNLCVALFSEPGERAWMEDPGYRGARSAFASGNLQISALPVDDEGLVATDARWQQERPRMVYISPAHQYPTGVIMSINRRQMLLNQAARFGSWIIEDDYDSEFRHQGEPLSALQGLHPADRVLHVGTFSKTLFPALRIGYLVLPAAIARDVTPWIASLRRGGHRVEQRALAEFIMQGDYARHLAAMRRLYRERQGILRQAIGRYIEVPHTLSAGGGGMHLALRFNQPLDDRQLVASARRWRIGPGALSDYYAGQQDAASGLVMGYGDTEAGQLEPAVRRLAQLMVTC